MRTWDMLMSSVALSMVCCAVAAKERLPTVPYVDLPRFMGDWYVLASIPTFLEKDAFNAVESYRLNADGTIATTFTFRKGSFDGPVRTLHPKGFVRDASHALWGMQFLWPIKAEYRVGYLNEEYSEVIIGRSARDYVWVMARAPQVSDGDYRRLLTVLEGLGYDPAKLRRVPQRWP